MHIAVLGNVFFERVDFPKDDHVQNENKHCRQHKLQDELVQINVHRYVDLPVLCGGAAHVVLVRFLNDDQSEDLRIRQQREDDEDGRQSVSRPAEHVLFEGEIDSDVALKCHTQHDPRRHEETNVLRKLVNLQKRQNFLRMFFDVAFSTSPKWNLFVLCGFFVRTHSH